MHYKIIIDDGKKTYNYCIKDNSVIEAVKLFLNTNEKCDYYEIKDFICAFKNEYDDNAFRYFGDGKHLIELFDEVLKSFGETLGVKDD